MKNSEFIDQTVEKLLAQGCYGYDKEYGECLYRTPEGKACAIGLWLTDRQAEVANNYEGLIMRSLAVHRKWPDLWPEVNPNVLDLTQEIHDDCAINDRPLSECLESILALKEQYPD